MADVALTLHPALTKLPDLPPGAMAKAPEGPIVVLHDRKAHRTFDLGATWEAFPFEGERPNVELTIDQSALATRSGVYLASFLNTGERVGLDWDKETASCPETVTLPHYVARSLDGGKTWRDFAKLHDDWTGDARDIIQLESGRLVLTSMKMLHRPVHHAVLTYWSDDDGLTWTPSNLVDLGGRGHHGGVSESTVTQLRDGRLWLLLRTNWGRFWEAFSDDEGVSWRVIRPSAIEASSAPGLLTRLASGRLMLLWNRPLPEGWTEFPLTGGDNHWSDVAVSNHRSELSLAFSEDDGAHWTDPVVIAHGPDPNKSWTSYPWALEVEPGHVWVTTMQGKLRASFREAGLLA